MSSLPCPPGLERAARRALQGVVIVAALAGRAARWAVGALLAVAASASVLLLGLGVIARSATATSLGGIAFLALLIVSRATVLATLRSLGRIALGVGLAVYMLAAVTLVIGGVWADHFGLVAVGGLLTTLLIVALTWRRRDFSWSLPPEGHLLRNRLKTQEEAWNEAQRLWPR